MGTKPSHVMVLTASLAKEGLSKWWKKAKGKGLFFPLISHFNSKAINCLIIETTGTHAINNIAPIIYNWLFGHYFPTFYTSCFAKDH